MAKKEALINKNTLFFLAFLFLLVIVLGNTNFVGNFIHDFGLNGLASPFASSNDADDSPSMLGSGSGPSPSTVAVPQPVPIIGGGKKLGPVSNGNDCRRTGFVGPSVTGTQGCASSFKDACNKALADIYNSKQAECDALAAKNDCKIGKLENCHCPLGSPNVCYSRGNNGGCIAHVGGAKCDCVGYDCK